MIQVKTFEQFGAFQDSCRHTGLFKKVENNFDVFMPDGYRVVELRHLIRDGVLYISETP